MSNLEQEPQIINRYKGTLIGGAVGDALGAPVESLRPFEVKVLAQNGFFDEMRGGGVYKWKEGQTTSDTDQTLCIVDSLIENGGYRPEDIALRFIDWYRSDPVDITRTTQISLSVLVGGTSFQESGIIAASLGAKAGNGSLMRTAPVGLFYRGRASDMSKAAGEISAITHAYPDCVLACQVASRLVSHLTTGYSLDRSLDLMKASYSGRSQAGEIVRRVLDGEFNRDNFSYVLNTLGVALSSLMEAENFEDAVVRSISVGWDTNTQATVTGSFAGALWGADSIPQRWASKLNPVGAVDLENKAEKLYLLNKSNAR